MPTNETESVCYLQPRTTDQRVAIANDFVKRFHYDIPLLVDPIENEANRLYAGWPERIYIVEGGTIRYKGGTGPFHFDPEEAAAWLAKRFPDVAASPSAPASASAPGPVADAQAAPDAGASAIVGACDWSGVLSLCVDYVAREGADRAHVLDRTGCKSQPVTQPCKTAAVVGSCRISEEKKKVEGRVIDDELRRARIVMYRYYADGLRPYTRESAKDACQKESGDWVE